MKLTPDEYAAIGRRVAKAASCPHCEGGPLADRAALWELCERLMAVEMEGSYWTILDHDAGPYPTREAAVAALLESLGGTE